MITIRNEAIRHINELPEELLTTAIEYLRILSKKKCLSGDIETEDELVKFVERGFEDARQGRVQPFKEAMADIRKRIAKQ